MKKYKYAIVLLLGLSTMIASCNRVDNGKASGKEKGHAYVNLGLPSGTMWATCNVGASSPEDYGDYLAWGETTTKYGYNWETYRWCNRTSGLFTKYNNSSTFGSVDYKIVLDSEDDAAHVSWGGKWRMPTNDEFQELLDCCTWTWTTQGGHNGYMVTSKSNGNSIFLPAAGNRVDTDFSNADKTGANGSYWSSSLCTSDSFCARCLRFSSWGRSTRDNTRIHGHSVRPVCHTSISSSNSQSPKIQGQESSQVKSTTKVSIKGYWWCTVFIDNQRQGFCFENGRFVHFACHPVFGLKEITMSVNGSYTVQGNTIQLVYDDGDKSTLQIDTEQYTDVCIRDGKYMMTRTGQEPAKRPKIR